MPLDIGKKTITYSLHSGERLTIHYMRDTHTRKITFTIIGETDGHYKHPAHDIGSVLYCAGSDITTACQMNYAIEAKELKERLYPEIP
jgi:hypothetical protein